MESPPLVEEISLTETSNKIKEGGYSWSKFKKVEMSVFNGKDLDSWLFRTNMYFQIHMLIESKKLTVSSFEGLREGIYKAVELKVAELTIHNCGKFLASRLEWCVHHARNATMYLRSYGSEVAMIMKVKARKSEVSIKGDPRLTRARVTMK